MEKVLAVKTLVDIWGCCPIQLGSVAVMNDIVRKAIDASELNLSHHAYQCVSEQEYIVMCIVTCGPITLHVFPTDKYVSIDVCLSGDLNPMRVVEEIVENILHEDCTNQFISRGF